MSFLESLLTSSDDKNTCFTLNLLHLPRGNKFSLDSEGLIFLANMCESSNINPTEFSEILFPLGKHKGFDLKPI